MVVPSVPQKCDIAVVGGGPVGLTLALALARRGMHVVIADQSPPATGGRMDSLAWFIAFGCWRIFRALGLETALLANAEPVTQVEARGRLGGVAFIAEDCSEHALGYMVEAQGLTQVLLESVRREPGVTLLSGQRVTAVAFGPAHATLTLPAATVEAGLVVGCDGVNSLLRRQAGLRFEGHDYDAAAISATLLLSQPHRGAARQIFLATGPMAALPLKADAAGVDRANLIWTERAPRAQALMALSDAEFERELARQAGDFLPGARVQGARASFPLRLYVAERFDAPRLALAGDAAHVIHPLAGQGLNLGLKDVAALVDVIGDAARVGLDIGSAAVLARYTRWRRADVIAVATAMEGFARAFTSPLPVRLAAGAGLAAAGLVPGLRKLFAREGGADLGELPSLMQRTAPH